MHGKSNPQHGRRTPLSLNAAASAKQQHNQQQQQQHSQSQQHNINKLPSGTNGNSNVSHQKTESKYANQKTEEVPLVELKETVHKETKKQQLNVDKKQQSQQLSANDNIKRNDEKKSQNGSYGKNNGNAKEKQQQQSKQGTAVESVKEKNEKVEKVNTNEKAEKIEKGKASKIDKDEKGEKKESVTVDEKPERETKAERNKLAEKSTEVEKLSVSNSEEKMLATTTPTKAKGEPKLATSTKITPKAGAEKATTSIKPSATEITAIEDVEMESCKVDTTPVKGTTTVVFPIPSIITTTINPTATSTPGKMPTSKKGAAKSEIKPQVSTGSSPDRSSCPRSYSQISGRRSIRPLNDYTPSHFQSNSLFRESYRRINTELDVSSTTNTSLNVTVGSEVPNNSSFFFFGRGRKRERTPPQQSQSAMELQTDVDLSPPKRARLDMHGFFSAMASPLTLLRSRFAKASIESSTPVKLRKNLASEDEESEVQNVSGVSEHEELLNGEEDEITATAEEVKPTESGEKMSKLEEDKPSDEVLGEKDDKQGKCSMEQATTADAENNEDIRITETPIEGKVGDSIKMKRCSVM